MKNKEAIQKSDLKAVKQGGSLGKKQISHTEKLTKNPATPLRKN